MTTTTTRERHTVTVPENEIHAFQRAVTTQGGRITRSCFSGRGYTVTYVL